MNAGKAPVCQPTWRGHIETTKDALIVFEACFNGTLAHCFRRPHDRERNQLIVSGNVFVYEEATSGIKRWTDGIPWSPSRILTNFLIYRQLNSPFPPGEKKRATKRSQRPLKAGEPYPASASSTPVTDETRPFPPESPNPSIKTEENNDKDANRGLVGSLVDSYEFKEAGLLKKTMTVTVNHVQHHLVSYYSLEDAKHNLRTPREDPNLKDLRIRDTLLNQPKFKFPNLDDAGDGSFDQLEPQQNTYPGYGYPTAYPNGYDARMYAGLQVSSPMGYQAGVYAPSQPASTGQGYPSIAPTTTSFGPPVQYTQHASLSHQHPYSNMNQQPHYQGPPSHAQYQSQHFSGHSHEMQHSGYQSHTVASALPRSNGSLEYPTGPQNESGLGHDPYSANGIKIEGMVPTSQPQAQQTSQQAWQIPYSPQSWSARPEGSYGSYRPQQP